MQNEVMSFEKLVADAQAEMEKSSKGGRNDWFPTDGTYFCRMVELQTGTFQDKKTGKGCFWIKPIYQIEDHPTLKGQTFQGDFYSSKSPGSLRAMAGFIAAALGQRIPTVTNAYITQVQQAVLAGLWCDVQASTNENGYTNARLTQVHSVDAPAAAK